MKRKLKIEDSGPGKWSKKSAESATIRLKGQWLRRLGFAPGHEVELTAISPGVLEIRLVVEQSMSPALAGEFQISAMRLDHAIAADEARKKLLAETTAGRAIVRQMVIDRKVGCA